MLFAMEIIPLEQGELQRFLLEMAWFPTAWLWASLFTPWLAA